MQRRGAIRQMHGTVRPKPAFGQSTTLADEALIDAVSYDIALPYEPHRYFLKGHARLGRNIYPFNLINKHQARLTGAITFIVARDTHIRIQLRA
jgi:hypothetical protein